MAGRYEVTRKGQDELRRQETKRIRRIIAEAVAEQGPAAKEQYGAAVDVMSALSRAGFRIVRDAGPGRGRGR